eukprot:771764-Pleurochrysis_carterae.AAC.1
MYCRAGYFKQDGNAKWRLHLDAFCFLPPPALVAPAPLHRCTRAPRPPGAPLSPPAPGEPYIT